MKLLEFVECIEEALGIRAINNFMPLQSGDGVHSFVDWYRIYYGV